MQRSTPAPLPTVPALLLVLLVGYVTGPVTVSGQELEADPPWTLQGGVNIGAPANLYDGDIRSRGVTAASLDGARTVATFTTEYTEHMGARLELWAGLSHHLFDEHYLFLRGRYGRASSEGSYRGGGALPRTFERDVAWVGGDALFAARLIDGAAFTGNLVAGPSFSVYSLDMSTGGRDVLVRKAAEVLGSEVEGGTDWSDRSWFSVEWILGAEGRIRLSPTVGLHIGLDGRILQTSGSAFQGKAKEDIEKAIDGEATISYQGYTGWAPTLSVGLEVALPGDRDGAHADGDEDDEPKARAAPGGLPAALTR